MAFIFALMIHIGGYMEVTYKELQKVMSYHRRESDISDFKIAQQLKVTSQETVRNCFQPEMQKVSDIKLSQLMKILDIGGCVLYEDGKKKYFILDTPEFVKIKKSKDGRL